jgi:N-acetyl sugar amidotransferase
LAFDQRNVIDWDQRKKEFLETVSQFKHNEIWDCIIPVSGGKDSTAQVIKVLELGLNPLCINSRTCDLSNIGRDNLENIRRLGVDLIEYAPNQNVRWRLNRLGLEIVGDISWPEHVGIFTIPIHAAIQFRVPLIIWGENSQNEYGGPATAQNNRYLNRSWLEEFGGLLGLRITDLVKDYGFSQKELALYTYPSDKTLSIHKVTGLFLGYFFPWNGHENTKKSLSNGFRTYPQLVEGSIVDYENLDNYQTGIHDYFKYLKFGFGRATDIASILIRRNLLTRSDAATIVAERDGRFPSTYLGKPLCEILDPLGLDENQFRVICDQFTNPKIFAKDADGNYNRRPDGSPSRLHNPSTEIE